MLTPNRTTQLDDLLGTSIASFDIPEEAYLLAVSRYEDLAAWLSAYWHGSPTDGVIYPQGAFRLGTVVQPIKKNDEYDVDLVCRRDLAKESTTQAVLKADVGDGVRLYIATGPDGHPMRSEGKRCWTLHYPGEPFHMDILPAVPDAEGVPNAILLTDKELRKWQHSNPIDFADWFHRRMRAEFLETRAMVAKRMEVAEVPDWLVKTTLQRTVQALKRHRDLYFSDPKCRTASVIVSTLAARAYSRGGTLYEVLVDVTAKMPGLVECRNGVYWVENPVQPAENFADRWRGHPERAQRFFEWMEQAQADFLGYGSERGVDRVLEKIAKTFGEGAAQHAGKVEGTNVVRAREAGVLGVDAAGLLGSATRRPAPRHTFHGDAPVADRS
ncbi:MAG: nucleotidyltransferase domain-containing protein [Acidimicrobiales bacterium]